MIFQFFLAFHTNTLLVVQEVDVLQERKQEQSDVVSTPAPMFNEGEGQKQGQLHDESAKQEENGERVDFI